MNRPLRVLISRVWTIQFCLLLSMLSAFFSIGVSIYKLRQPVNVVDAQPVNDPKVDILQAGVSLNEYYSADTIMARERMTREEFDRCVKEGRISPLPLTIQRVETFTFVPKNYTIRKRERTLIPAIAAPMPSLPAIEGDGR